MFVVAVEESEEGEVAAVPHPGSHKALFPVAGFGRGCERYQDSSGERKDSGVAAVLVVFMSEVELKLGHGSVAGNWRNVGVRVGVLGRAFGCETCQGGYTLVARGAELLLGHGTTTMTTIHTPGMVQQASGSQFTPLRLSVDQSQDDRRFFSQITDSRKPLNMAEVRKKEAELRKKVEELRKKEDGARTRTSALPPPAGSSSIGQKLPSIPRKVDEAHTQYTAELSAELSAKRRLAQMRRTIQRVTSDVVLQEQVERRLARAAAVRADIDERRSGPRFRMFRNKVHPASDEEIGDFAEMLLGAMALAEPDEHARGWYKLYKYIDKDSNGQIEYHELLEVVRENLRVDTATIPDEVIQAFWIAVDADQSGAISLPEFGKMMRLGEKRRSDLAAAEAAEAAAKGIRTRSGVPKTARPTTAEVKLAMAAEEARLTRHAALEEVRQSALRLDREASRLERQIRRLGGSVEPAPAAALGLSKSASAPGGAGTKRLGKSPPKPKGSPKKGVTIETEVGDTAMSMLTLPML